jgi:Domain of unknown function (DUF4062)
MTYDARVIKVFIASPSDVPDERKIVREVIHEWNATHSEHRKLVLLPIGWESHSSPEMGDRPQAIINKRVLKDCDVLVAAFWTRYGTPTGKAASGTAEEIEEHINANKLALIYFSTLPVDPDKIDHEQLKSVKAFKEECRTRGLVEGYSSLGEFRGKFSRQLAQKVNLQFSNDLDAIDSREGRELAFVEPFEPSLSNEARQLLGEAANGTHSTIMRADTMAGSHVQANGKDFVVQNDKRSEARWRAAVDELERQGFIEDRGGKGEVFFVTNSGFEAVDTFSK